MRKIILTAINNNDHFYFRQLIPFLLSLQATNYEGDIGVIGYRLSQEKISILRENNILVFDIQQNQYDTIYLDRQWQVAKIAEEQQYDYLALYDTDIWFPNPEFTLFDEITNTDNLYCAYDHAYGDFIDRCIDERGIRKTTQQLSSFLLEHKKPWQVGLVAGHFNAWKNYQKYIEKQLKRKNVFLQVYGIDTLLICLYSVDKKGISELSMKYNCLPTNGDLKHSNLSPKGKLGKWHFSYNGEPVQGLHVAGPFRIHEHNYYNFTTHYRFYYHKKGRKYRLEKNAFKEVILDDINISSNINNENVLTIKSIQLEKPIKFTQDENFWWFIELTANAQIILKNETDKPITFQFSTDHCFGFDYSHAAFIVYNDGAPTLIHNINQWQEITLIPQDELTFAARDLDSKNKMTWVIANVALQKK